MEKTLEFSLVTLIQLSLLAVSITPVITQAADVADIASKKCESCHGPQGNSDEKSIPSIAGLSPEYLYDSLKDFKSKKRIGEKVTPKNGKQTDMNEIAASLSKPEIKQLSQYFGDQVFIPRKQTFDQKLAKKGKKVYRKRCERCHDDNGRSTEDDMGRLAGQPMTYIQDQIEDFIDLKRKPPKKMAKQLKKLKPKEIPALVHFFAAQQ